MVVCPCAGARKGVECLLFYCHILCGGTKPTALLIMPKIKIAVRQGQHPKCIDVSSNWWQKSGRCLIDLRICRYFAIRL
jgi:hypothetical protein